MGWASRICGAVALVAAGAACSGSPGEGRAPAPDTSSRVASTVPASSTTSMPAPAFGAGFLTVGDEHACALDEDGRAWCWGYGDSGRLGGASGGDAAVPVPVATDARFRTLSAGRTSTCGITTDGRTLCWGGNARGQLGDGATGRGTGDADRPTPGEVLGARAFEDVAVGQLHVCALDGEGGVWCWGASSSGQLGAAVGGDQTAPIRAGGDLRLVRLAQGGDTTSCGVDADGAAWCWGSNNFGQLGDGTRTNVGQAEPRRVVGDHEFEALAVGRTHACGIDLDGSLWCWGRNEAGQLGDGTTTDRAEPGVVAFDLPVRQVTANDRVTCAVTDDGRGWCWGANVEGRLGDGTLDDHAVPAEVAGGRRWRELHAGEAFTCGRTTDDAVFCWGTGQNGRLGDGSGEDRLVPVPVAVP
ncbi:MAG TPA: hypothetical protein ENK55_06065 [Actinobacteria bacterium]|nr:hypothetical protein [Actinomycetota bacterium]